MVNLPKVFWSLVWGASSGFQLFRMEIGDKNGPRLVQQWKNPLDETEEGIFWNINGLSEILAKTLEWVSPGELIFPTGWGADWVSVDIGGGVVGKPLHYGTLYKEGSPYFDRVLANMSKQGIFLRTGGASVDKYQLYAHLMWLLDNHPGWVANDQVSRLISINDLITRWLCGRDGQDQAMRQSQGLLSAQATSLYLDLFGVYGDKISGLIHEWHSFDLDAVMAGRGRVIIPATHDSGLSRLWGSLFGKLLIWTGTHTGVSIADHFGQGHAVLCQLSEQGFSREGAGRLGFINANVHCWGKIWKALRGILGVSYTELAKIALQRTDSVVLDKRHADDYFADPENGANAILDLAQGDGPLAARTIMASSVSAIRYKTSKLSALCGETFDTAVVTGGFSENLAHRQMLERQSLRVITPPFAELATVMGSFVEAICRIEKVPPKEAAKILLPNLKLP